MMLAFRSVTVLAVVIVGASLLQPRHTVLAADFVGVAGCAAASCHGGKSISGGEYTHWATRDAAHRRAYDVLLSDVSQAMARKLWNTEAHREARCLACHTTGAESNDAVHGERFAIEFGVACESCHGAAGRWVARHTERSWKSLSAEKKEEFGYRDLRSLGRRAETCVACHVGSSNGQVNHDMIAAGHPRLSFELAAYHALLPKHWDEAAAVRRDPAQEVRLWALGQAKSAYAIAQVAGSRAEAARRNGFDHVHSDLAEHDCHACHHDLRAETWRGRRTAGGGLGTARWGSWAVDSAHWFSGESATLFGHESPAAHISLTEWIGLMREARLGTIPVEKVAVSIRQASIDLAAWSLLIESSRYDATQTTHLLQRLIATESDAAWSSTWDGQAQRYLAVVAVSQSLRNLTGREPFPQTSAERAFSPFQQRLMFPKGSSTPHDFNPDEFDRLFRELRRLPPQ